MSKTAYEIASDITIAWMQAVTPRGNIDAMLEMLSSDSICKVYSAVCKTILQCESNAGIPEAHNKPENW